jgi:pimeloyl-ACP methyl ester carboxylesterase
VVQLSSGDVAWTLTGGRLSFTRISDPCSRAFIVPRVGHFLMLEDPGTFNRILREVIRELTR